MWLFWCKLSRAKGLRRVDSINQSLTGLRINLSFKVLTQLFDKFSIDIRMQENVGKTTGETGMGRHKRNTSSSWGQAKSLHPTVNAANGQARQKPHNKNPRASLSKHI